MYAISAPARSSAIIPTTTPPTSAGVELSSATDPIVFVDLLFEDCANDDVGVVGKLVDIDSVVVDIVQLCISHSQTEGLVEQFCE